MSVNKVILVGNLGANPEMRFTQGGQAVANLRIATSERWTDRSGQKQESTEWHRVVAFGKLAEICGQYLTKGRQIYIEGELQTRQWTDKEGGTRYTTEVRANEMVMLGGRGAGSEGGGASAPAENEYAQVGNAEPASGAEPPQDDDLPF
jgi:single-strand DNA-binding protein